MGASEVLRIILKKIVISHKLQVSSEYIVAATSRDRPTSSYTYHRPDDEQPSTQVLGDRRNVWVTCSCCSTILPMPSVFHALINPASTYTRLCNVTNVPVIICL